MRLQKLKQFIVVFCLCCGLIAPAFAGSQFVIQDIEIQGLQHIKEGTVLDYLPVHTGQTLHRSDTANIVRALYKTGFFSHVSLQQRGQILVIMVQERPTISRVTMTGNKIMPTNVLVESLASVGLAQGKFYNKSMLDNIQDSLQNQYFDRGNYAATVDYKIIPDKNNQVAVHIDIKEGVAARIKQIKIIGNEAFSERKLRHQLQLTTPKFWSFVTKSDQYSKEKFNEDLENLHAFYLNQGYVKFQIISSQVSITPDRQDVYIVIRISEGEQFHVSGYKVTGDMVLPEKQLEDLVDIKVGDVFSRQAVTDATIKMGNKLGDSGFSFATVRPMPELDEVNAQIFLTFLIEPGHKAYVRRISFTGNTKTADEVLRRELRQMEGAVVSRNNINVSEYRMNMLGFFKAVKATTHRVPGSDDLVDLNFQMIEEPSASVSLSAGYSDTSKFTLNGGYHQPNFLGTGDAFGLNFRTDRYTRSYSASFYDPYHTPDGIGRGFSLYAHVTDYDKGMVTTYSSDRYGLNVYYNLPVAEKHSVTMGYAFQVTDLQVGSSASAEVKDFTRKYGKHFYNVLFNAGWSYMNIDKPVFPTKGLSQGADIVFAAPGGSDQVSYYKANYSARYYHPIYHDWIVSLHGELGYGNGLFNTKYLPFFENYYAGGIGIPGAVQGYKGYSIGPKDSTGRNYGGNFLVDGVIALIVPSPVTPDILRLSAFLDFGNVYSDVSVPYCTSNSHKSVSDCAGLIGRTPSGSGPVRVSAGVSAEWRTPMGPVVLSLAKPLNMQDGDVRDTFQFTVGAGIG